MDAEWSLKFQKLLIRALASLSPNNPATRRRLYARARQVLDEHLRDPEGGYSPAHVELEMRMFQFIIRTLERDIAAGVDVYTEEYGLADLNETRERITRKLLGSPATVDPGCSEEEIAGIVNRMTRLLAEQDRRSKYALRGRTNIINSSLTGMVTITKVLASESKLTLVWFALKPALFFISMRLFYSFNGDRVIFNMTPAAFAATGTCFLVLYQETAKRVYGAILSYKFLMSIPQISWFAVGMAEAILFFLINTIMMIVIMGFLIWLDQAPFPKEPLVFAALWVVLWWVSVIIGLFITFFIVRWRFVGRALSAALHFVALFSGIPFVTEQLPEDVSHILLFNPLLHLIQALRVAYFDGYDSQQVSLPYFFICLFFVMPFTFLLVCSNRSRIMPS